MFLPFLEGQLETLQTISPSFSVLYPDANSLASNYSSRLLKGTPNITLILKVLEDAFSEMTWQLALLPLILMTAYPIIIIIALTFILISDLKVNFY